MISISKKSLPASPIFEQNASKLKIKPPKERATARSPLPGDRLSLSTFPHFLEETDWKKIKIGQRVEAVFEEKRRGHLLDIKRAL